MMRFVDSQKTDQTKKQVSVRSRYPDDSPSEALAEQLGLSLVTEDQPGGSGLWLEIGDRGLVLRDPLEPRRVISTAFDSKRWQVSRRNPLGRAIGRGVEGVVDATAGLGGDAALLVRMGYRVVAIERSSILGAMLSGGVRGTKWEERLTILTGDSMTLLATLNPSPEVIYLDPMYPSKRRPSALSKKSLRVLRALVGDDPDADQLLLAAREAASRRVVVKRPTHAPPLGAEPDFYHQGKMARYDVYLRGAF